MKKKKYYIFIFLLFIIIQCKKDYIRTIENYFDYLKKGNCKKAYSLLSSEDRSLKTLNEYINENESTPISKNIIKRIKYNIIEVKVSENKNISFIKVEIREPDLIRIYKILPELLNYENDERTIDKIFKENNKIIVNNYLTKYENYKLFFEENKWVIYADYKKKKYLFGLLEEANKYYRDYFYTEALEKYERILEFNENDTFVIDKVISIKEKINYQKKYIKFDYKILKNKTNGVIINITIKNKGTIVVKKAISDIMFYNKGVLILKEKKVLFDKNNNQIGFNEEISKEIEVSEIKDNFEKINCVLSAIEF